MKTRNISLIAVCMLILIPSEAYAQFRIKIPKIKKPNPTQPKTPPKETLTSAAAAPISAQNRQMVMDDGFTFFDAEPVKEYDSAARLNKDIGWHLTAYLRVLGDFPNRSAFRVVVKQNGKKLIGNRCNGAVYTKEGDPSIRTEIRRRERDLNFENYMDTGFGCKKETAVIKPVGKMDVEVYVIDGDTDEEKLVRTYKIDVHRAPRVRGSTTNPQPDVAHYYISRNAEAAVAFILMAEGHANYFKKPFDTSSGPGYRTLVVYTSYSPGRNRQLPGDTYARCKVNGQPLKLDWDQVNLSSESRPQEYAVYTDRLTAQYKRGSAYRDDVIFRRLNIVLPIYSEETQYQKPRMKMENTRGDWECRILSNGEPYRTLRWKVGPDGKIEPHPEQQNGNINLFHNTFLVDMEIPEGGTEWDHRLAPMPNDGLFYGIPWSTAEGKAMAARMPKKGNPFHVPSTKAQ